MPKGQNYDHLAKLLIIGDSGVGKTNILLRFCENNFMPSHLSTIGIDFKIKTIDIQGKRIRMQIWDTAGQERFKTITQAYYKGAMGIILVYSVSDQKSFHSIDNWMRQIKIHASQGVSKVLIANKCDSTEREVSYQQGKDLADSFGVQFYEVSAKDNVHISQTFNFMGKQIKQQIQAQNQLVFSKNTPLSPGKQLKKGKNKKKCC